MSETKPKYDWMVCWQSDPSVKPMTRLLLSTLLSHMNDHGESCYPTIDQIMYESGMSRGTVVKHLKIAFESGWVAKKKLKKPGQQWMSNTYKAVTPSDAVGVRWKDTEQYKSIKANQKEENEWEFKGSTNCDEGSLNCDEGGSNGGVRQSISGGKAVQTANASTHVSSHSSSQKEKGDSLSTATPKKPNPRILPGSMTECDGECQYDHPSQLCQPCKQRRPKAKTFGQNMFKNLERSELWQGYFEPAKAATIAKNWFSLDHDYESREVAQELDRMIADSKFNAQKPIAISTAIERAAVNLEMRR